MKSPVASKRKGKARLAEATSLGNRKLGTHRIVYQAVPCASGEGEKGFGVDIHLANSSASGFELLLKRLHSMKPLFIGKPHRIRVTAYSPHFDPLGRCVPRDVFVRSTHKIPNAAPHLPPP